VYVDGEDDDDEPDDEPDGCDDDDESEPDGEVGILKRSLACASWLQKTNPSESAETAIERWRVALREIFFWLLMAEYGFHCSVAGPRVDAGIRVVWVAQNR